MKFKNKNLKTTLLIILPITIGIFLPIYCIHASDQTSASFIIRDLNLGVGGGYETSANFMLFGSGDLTSTGESSSANFGSHSGFMYYPYVAEGSLVAVLNGANAELSWAGTDTALGFNVSGYEVGIASVSTGPYTYTSVGTDLDYIYVGLAPGDYFFVVRTLDGLGNSIAISDEETLNVPQSISFSISDNTIGFSSITAAAARFATGDNSGSSADTSAHNLQIATNASSGYTISYSGTALTGPEVITEATIVNDPDGAQNSKQFALSFSTDGGATITSSYDHDPTPTNRNWKFTTGTSELIATESSPTPLETINAYYLANITANTSSGVYEGTITYIATANY
ncbi:MAG: hypothetical protein V4664_03740 [Patescibacteria group bacterium]